MQNGSIGVVNRTCVNVTYTDLVIANGTVVNISVATIAAAAQTNLLTSAVVTVKNVLLQFGAAFLLEGGAPLPQATTSQPRIRIDFINITTQDGGLLIRGFFRKTDITIANSSFTQQNSNLAPTWPQFDQTSFSSSGKCLLISTLSLAHSSSFLLVDTTMQEQGTNIVLMLITGDMLTMRNASTFTLRRVTMFIRSVVGCATLQVRNVPIVVDGSSSMLIDSSNITNLLNNAVDVVFSPVIITNSSLFSITQSVIVSLATGVAKYALYVQYSPLTLGSSSSFFLQDSNFSTAGSSAAILFSGSPISGSSRSMWRLARLNVSGLTGAFSLYNSSLLLSDGANFTADSSSFTGQSFASFSVSQSNITLLAASWMIVTNSYLQTTGQTSLLLSLGWIALAGGSSILFNNDAILAINSPQPAVLLEQIIAVLNESSSLLFTACTASNVYAGSFPGSALAVKLATLIVVNGSMWQFSGMSFYGMSVALTREPLVIDSSTIQIGLKSQWNWLNSNFTANRTFACRIVNTSLTILSKSSWLWSGLTLATDPNMPTNGSLSIVQTNISILGQSSWRVTKCGFRSSGPGNAFSIAQGTVMVWNSSTVIIDQSTFESGQLLPAMQLGPSLTLRVEDGSFAQIASSSFNGSSAGFLLAESMILVSLRSTLSFSSLVAANVSSGQVFAITNSSVLIQQSSSWLLSNNKLASVAAEVVHLGTAAVTLGAMSSFVVSGNALTAQGSDVFILPTSSSSLDASAWVLFSSNNMTSDSACFSASQWLVTVGSALSVIGNNCTGATFGQFQVANTTGAQLLARCNTLNGNKSYQLDPPFIAPTGGNVCSCVPQTDCFPPLTAVNSTCNAANVCQCSTGGFSPMCLPSSSVGAFAKLPCFLSDAVLSGYSGTFPPVCTTIMYTNVTLDGSVALILSMADIMNGMGGSSASNISAVFSGCSLTNGAQLVIDGGDGSLAVNGIVVSVLIQSVRGIDGGLLIRGTFPPGSYLNISNASFRVTTYDIAPQGIPRSAYALRSKPFILADVNLTSGSSLLVADSTFVSSNPNSTILFFIFGTFTIAAASSVLLSNLQMNGGSDCIGVLLSARTLVDQSSMFVLSQVTINTAAGRPFDVDGLSMRVRNSSMWFINASSFITTSADASFKLSSVNIFVLGSSNWTIANTICSNSAGHVLFVDSSVVFVSGSLLAIYASRFSSPTNSGSALFFSFSTISLSVTSTWAISKSTVFAKTQTALFILSSTVRVSNSSIVQVSGNAFSSSLGGCVNASNSSLIASNFSQWNLVSNSFSGQTNCIVLSSSTMDLSSSSLWNMSWSTIASVGSSGLVLTQANVSVVGGSVLLLDNLNVTAGQTGLLFYIVGIMIANSSLLALTHSAITGATGAALSFDTSSVYVLNSSVWSVATVSLRGESAVGFQFLMSQLIVAVSSVWLLTACNISAIYMLRSPTTTASVTVGDTSWIAWKSLNVTASSGSGGNCMLGYAGPVFNLTSPSAVFSLVQMTCLAPASIFSAGVNVLSYSSAASYFQKCNQLNGNVTTASLPPGYVGMAGDTSCSSCSQQMDCFVPLTIANPSYPLAGVSTPCSNTSTCSKQCPCLTAGAYSSLCLPVSNVYITPDSNSSSAPAPCASTCSYNGTNVTGSYWFNATRNCKTVIMASASLQSATVNFDVSAMMSLPVLSAPVSITVTGTSIVTSTLYISAPTGAAVSVTIDGCTLTNSVLMFNGSFVSSSSILITRTNFLTSTVVSAIASVLHLRNFTLGGGSSFSISSVMMVNTGFTVPVLVSSGVLAIADGSVLTTQDVNVTVPPGTPISFGGPVTVVNSSSLVFQRIAVFAGRSAILISFSSSVVVDSMSTLLFDLVLLLNASACCTYGLLVAGAVNISRGSQWIVSRTNISTEYPLSFLGPVAVTSQSAFVVNGSTVVGTGVASALNLTQGVSLIGQSLLAVLNSTLMSGGPSSMTTNLASLSMTQDSFTLIRGANLSGNVGCLNIGPLANGQASVVDVVCSSLVLSTAIFAPNVHLRCDSFVNGSDATLSLGGLRVPCTAQCNASADCYGCLTNTSAACTAAQCPCVNGGVGQLCRASGIAGPVPCFSAAGPPQVPTTAQPSIINSTLQPTSTLQPATSAPVTFPATSAPDTFPITSAPATFPATSAPATVPTQPPVTFAPNGSAPANVSQAPNASQAPATTANINTTTQPTSTFQPATSAPDTSLNATQAPTPPVTTSPATLSPGPVDGNCTVPPRFNSTPDWPMYGNASSDGTNKSMVLRWTPSFNRSRDVPVCTNESTPRNPLNFFILSMVWPDVNCNHPNEGTSGSLVFYNYSVSANALIDAVWSSSITVQSSKGLTTLLSAHALGPINRSVLFTYPPLYAPVSLTSSASANATVNVSIYTSKPLFAYPDQVSFSVSVYLECDVPLSRSTPAPTAPCVDTQLQQVTANKSLISALVAQPQVLVCGSNASLFGSEIPMDIAVTCPISVIMTFLPGLNTSGNGSSPVALATSFGTIAGTKITPPATTSQSLVIEVQLLSPSVSSLATTTSSTYVTVAFTSGEFNTTSSCGTHHSFVPVGWSTSFSISPLRPTSALRQSVATGSVVSAAVSSSLSNPTVALQQAVLMTFSSVAGCSFSDVEPLDTSSSPLGWKEGDPVGAYYRGTIYAFFLVQGCVAVAALIVLLVATAVIGRDGTCDRHESLLIAASKIHFPSLFVVPFAVLLEGATLSCASLLRLSLTASDVALAAVCLVLLMSGLILTFLATSDRFWFTCVVSATRANEGFLPFEVNPVWQRIRSCIEWEGEWRDTTADHFKKRYVMLFDTNRVAWFAAFEIGTCFLQSAIAGIRSNDIAACRAQSLLLLVLNIAVALLVLYLMPCGAIVENVFLVVMRLLSLLCAGLTVYTVFAADSNGSDMVDLASSIGSVVGMVQTGFQLLMGALEFTRWMYQRSKGGRKEDVDLLFRESGPHAAEEPLLVELSLLSPESQAVLEEPAKEPVSALDTARPLEEVPGPAKALDDDDMEAEDAAGHLSLEQLARLGETDLADTKESALFMELRRRQTHPRKPTVAVKREEEDII